MISKPTSKKPTGGEFVITIDGPAGSGKSTVSSKLARKLGYTFLTTGAFYRGLAVLCLKKNIPPQDGDLVASLAHYKGFRIEADQHGTQVFIDDVNVTADLNNDETAQIASQVSAHSPVRKALLEAQRSFNRPPGLVAEGRDCGTVVFPDAPVKIFLTASLDLRAQRRSSEYKGSNSQDLAKNIASRDKADSSRKAAPLSKAPDAIEIDTSTLSVDEVVAKIEKIIKTRLDLR